MAKLNTYLTLGSFIPNNSNIGADINYNSYTLGGVGTYLAQQFQYYKTIDINRLAFVTTGPTTGSNISIFAGVCTSIGTNGLWPSNVNGTVGSGSSLNFSSKANYTYIQSAASNIPKVVALESTFTLNSGQIYYLAAQVYARTSGSVNLGALSDSNFIYRSQNSSILVTQSAGAASITQQQVLQIAFVPGYYSGSGDTIWYMDGHLTGVDNTVTHQANPYFEYGCEFEINDFSTQTLNLDSFTFIGTRDLDGNTVYTCKIYDNNLSVVGTALTEKGYGQTSSTTVRYALTFHFIPSIKISPNFKYTVGIAGTGFTTTTGSHIYLANNTDIHKNQYLQSNKYVYRTDPNAVFSDFGSTSSANCRFYFSTSSKMRREHGN